MDSPKSNNPELLPFEIPLPNSEEKLRFLPIPAGTLRMGARGREIREEPIHPVSVAAFYLAETPITQAQFKAWTGSADYADWFAKNAESFDLKEPHRNYFEGEDDHPAEQVTWYEAEAFAEWLNKYAPQPGGSFQLPTEAQWEHACRAGSDTDYWNGDGEAALAQVGWCQGNAEERTHSVQQPPQRTRDDGLRDLHGNVSEWCQDVYDPNRYRLWLPHAATQAAIPPAGNQPLAEQCARAAAVLRRFADGKLELREEDHQDLAWIGQVVARFEADRKFWQVIERAVAATFHPEAGKPHIWPEDAQGHAGGAVTFFNSMRQSFAAEGDPARVLRGGCWFNPARYCRSAYRDRGRPGNRDSDVGFRLAWVPRVPVQSSQAPVAERAGVAGTRRDDAAEAAQARGAGMGEQYTVSTNAANNDGTHGESLMAEASGQITLRALSSVNGVNWEQSGPQRATQWPVGPDKSVVKLVVGQLASAGEAKNLDSDAWAPVIQVLESGVCDYFPNLTHLHVWGLPITRLGLLPDALQELDVREVAQLVEVQQIPHAALSLLVLGDCPELERLPVLESSSSICFDSLEELELFGGARIPEGFIHEMVERSGTQLKRLIMNGCGKLGALPKLKVGLEDLRARGCEALTGLPERWPPKLRRLELAETPITRLPKGGKLDYINLAGTRKLESLGDYARLKVAPRTLFLHGSAIKEPLAALHGNSPEDNVAAAVWQYFKQRQLVGDASIRRCKLLFLGNGAAGKTTLALALEGDAQPVESAKALGSTHGIRLHAVNVEPVQGSSINSEIRIDHWDFGGQAIYHNAHAKFVEAGALFIILWSPEQDGKTHQRLPGSDYEDELLPLRGWLDLVSQATQGQARMGIVAARRAELTQDLLNRCNRQRQGYIAEQYPLYVFEGDGLRGDFAGIRSWVQKKASEVVEDDGQLVPAHWKIAEDMVTHWLETQPRGPASVMEFTDFCQRFREEVQARVAPDRDTEGSFGELADALSAGTFSINEEITRQTLAVLTKLGVIYWSPTLFERRVIVGQDWALQGIYTALSRESSIYNTLIDRHGVFTRQLLNELVWSKTSDYADIATQELLMSFMVDCHVCFPLRSRRWEGKSWQDPTYISIKHLPTLASLSETTELKKVVSEPAVCDALPAITNRYLTPLHWHALLVKLGQDYGDHALYASDCFYLPCNADGQSALIRVKFEPDPSHESRIYIHCTGHDADALKATLSQQIEVLLPDSVSGKWYSGDRGGRMIVGHPPKPVKLFISYARKGDPARSADRYDYESAVDAIEQRLKDWTAPHIDVIRDRRSIAEVGSPDAEGKYTSIPAFMNDAVESDYVLIIHSRKYWTSEYCMYEAWRSFQEASHSSVPPHQRFILLDLDAHIAKAEGLTGPRDMSAASAHWLSFAQTGQLSKGLQDAGCSARQLGLGASSFIENEYPKLNAHDGGRDVYAPERIDEIVEWIARRCGVVLEQQLSTAKK